MNYRYWKNEILQLQLDFRCAFPNALSQSGDHLSRYDDAKRIACFFRHSGAIWITEMYAGNVHQSRAVKPLNYVRSHEQATH